MPSSQTPIVALPDSVTAEQLCSIPIERAETIPSSWYLDRQLYRAEQARLFATAWQLVGHESQLHEAGRHVLGSVGGHPVVVVRDEMGSLRAFYNVCRHRGGPLAVEDGCSKVLQCKYHGWTYKLDGSLRGVPRWNYVELFDKKDYGLVPLSVAVWQGLVFVSLSKETDPIGELVDGMRSRIAPIDIAALRFARRVEYDVACNWKVYVDNYLEGYHVPFVHPELCALYQFQDYQTEVGDRYSLQTAPLTEEDNVYTTGGGRAFYYFVFPNIMLNILPGRLQANLVQPTAVNRCRVVFWYYYADVSSADAQARIEDDVNYSHRVQVEDGDICARVQAGLESPAYDVGRFSVEQELGVYHFQDLLKRAYRGWRVSA